MQNRDRSHTCYKKFVPTFHVIAPVHPHHVNRGSVRAKSRGRYRTIQGRWPSTSTTHVSKRWIRQPLSALHPDNIARRILAGRG